MTKVSGTGKVPALTDGDVHVWESLAILEYLAEKFPQARLWPADPQARAQARAIAAEMHAGFVPLRRELPMNMWRPVKPRAAHARGGGECRAHRRHVDRLSQPLRRRRAVPVRCLRRGRRDVRPGCLPLSHLWGRRLGRSARAYMDAVMALPAWAEWRAAALEEPWVLAEDEVDWPTVLRQ